MARSGKIRLLLLAGVVVVIAATYGVQRWMNTSETPVPVVEQSTTETNKFANFDTSEAIEKAQSSPAGKIVTPKTMAEIEEIYKGITMIEVPHIFIDRIPDDWDIKTTADKTLYMKIITALILRTNEQILNERAAIRLLQEKRLKKIEWNKQEREFFNQMVEKYDAVLRRDETGQFTELLDKIDIIPPSLAVAQAILMTNWGRGNRQSIYGEFAWHGEKAYLPIKFDSLVKATDSFALQLNTRSQLFSFRDIRRRLIPYERHRYMGEILLDTMSQYMELDDKYVAKLQLAYYAGRIKELDHSCFKGTCKLFEKDPSLKFK